MTYNSISFWEFSRFRSHKALLLALVFTGFWTVMIGQRCQAEVGDDIIPKKQAEQPSFEAQTKASGESGEISTGVVVIVLLLGGFVFLTLELTVIPGFGIAGFTGTSLVLAGLILAFATLDLMTAVSYSALSLFALVLLIIWALKVLPHTSFGKGFILTAQERPEDGFVGVRDLSGYIGKEGIVLTMLRPSGIARIGEDRIDVVSEGEFLPKGTPVKVIEVRSNSLVVISTGPAPAEEEKS